MAKKKRGFKIKDDPAGIFVPAGVLLGLGFGFLYNNIPAFLFIGLGAGFLVMALLKIFKHKR